MRKREKERRMNAQKKRKSAQDTTVRGKIDVGPAFSAPKACQKSSGAVLIVAGTTHTTLGKGLDG